MYIRSPSSAHRQEASSNKHPDFTFNTFQQHFQSQDLPVLSQHSKWLPFKQFSLLPWPWLPQLLLPFDPEAASTPTWCSSALTTLLATPAPSSHQPSPSSTHLSLPARPTQQTLATLTRPGDPSTWRTCKLVALVSRVSFST